MTDKEKCVFGALILFLLVMTVGFVLAAIPNLDRLDQHLGPARSGHDPMGVRC